MRASGRSLDRCIADGTWSQPSRYGIHEQNRRLSTIASCRTGEHLKEGVIP